MASEGTSDFSVELVDAVIACESATSVAVLTIAKVHGFMLGIPNPGLMPTKKEILERTNWVDKAIMTLKSRGISAEGQIATTRHGVKLIARVAQKRQVQYVFVDGTLAKGWRRVVEGDLGSELQRKLRHTEIKVVIVEPSS